MHSTTHAPPAKLTLLIPGLALALGVGVVATVIGRAVPLVGGPVAGVVLGVLLASTLRPVQRNPGLAPGIKVSSSRLLQTAVVLLGAQVSLTQVLAVGWQSLPVMLGTLAACLLAAWGLGRALKVDDDLTILIGVGTAICGASAIAAITPVLKPAATKVAYALSTVFVFNIAAVLLFPWLGHALGMSQEAFGIFAGTAVNDTSSVVAAATTYGAEATETAVVVKLARTLMIIPIAMGLAYLVARRPARAGVTADSGDNSSTGAVAVGHTDAGPGSTGDRAPRPNPLKLIPWFLIGFIVVAALHPFLGESLTKAAMFAATFFITVALSAIGLSTDLAGLRRTGLTPVLLGGILWLVVSGTSLAIQALTTGLG